MLLYKGKNPIHKDNTHKTTKFIGSDTKLHDAETIKVVKEILLNVIKKY